VAGPADDRLSARNDLAWAISVGGIGTVAFAALLLFTWYFAATLFLIFAGMLLGVALNAMTNLLGRVVKLPHSLRLTMSVWRWRACCRAWSSSAAPPSRNRPPC
jgi:hypothetical protein